ncbi:MAG TPA: VOC family protein [Gemmatimonadaceae bacterium]|nr:VOC family protein [Gemmatimonadaceae bacterium]
MTAVLGIHHVTAIATDPQRNLDFYAGVLGLRFVKRTVNFDDPQTYHFYYGDGDGTPGSILTFFPWPGARRGRQGTGQAAVTSFAITPASLGFWLERLLHHQVKYQGPVRRGTGAHAEQVITFQDHDGLMLELVAHPAADSRTAWDGAPGIPADHALRGFHSVTLWQDKGDETERVLTDVLGFRPSHDAEGTHVFSAGDGGPGTLVKVRDIGGFVRAAGGAGTVHHVAFRAGDDAAEVTLRDAVVKAGLHATDVIDRKYFHSVYFREPGGVLFELATDPPGFTVDEPREHLGEALQLPSQYEPMRNEIQAVLPPIHLRVRAPASEMFAHAGAPEDVSGEALSFVHRYVPPGVEGEYHGDTTLLLLHGTGGDEEDLLPLGRALLPGAAMLSPRGKVLEGGAPRFFRRIAEGVFDQEDLRVRTAELAEFIDRAAVTYSFRRECVIAAGFSNGANIAANLLLQMGSVIRGAVLLSPMLPFDPEGVPALDGTAVFIGAGRMDRIAPADQVERLADVLRSAGADVTVHWHPTAHQITKDEVDAARTWLEGIARGH